MKIIKLKFYQAIYVGKYQTTYASVVPSTDRSQPLAGNVDLELVPGIGVAVTHRGTDNTTIVTFNNIASIEVEGFKAPAESKSKNKSAT